MIMNETHIENTTMNQILVGGQALRKLGSSRHTDDTDYLVYDNSTKETFTTSENIDYLNAANNKFFNEIYQIEKDNEVATPESLLELKAYALVQHYQNMNWAKVASTEFDMKFLVVKFEMSAPTIVKKYVSDGEYNEILDIINFNK